MGLDWIQHFYESTNAQWKGAYHMLILDGYKSYLSAEFQKFCKDYAIITLCLPAYSLHLT